MTTRTEVMNCFTGSLVHLLSERENKVVREADLLERGGGYLFRSGWDEYHFPEYTFDCILAAKRATATLGYELVEQRVGNLEQWLEIFEQVLAKGKRLIIWVNSSYLSYTKVYTERPGHLHAIVLEEINDGQARCFDPLILDRVPHSLVGYLKSDVLAEALFARVPNKEITNVLGRFFYLERAESAGRHHDPRDALKVQAQAHFTNLQHRKAVEQYKRNCGHFFYGDPEACIRAARRLFDHINVLYVIPSLGHLETSLARGGFPDACRQSLNHLLVEWKSLAILALKLEATGDRNLVSRIESRFDRIIGVTDELWLSVLNA